MTPCRKSLFRRALPPMTLRILVASSAVEDVRRSRASRGDVEDEEDSTLTRSSAATTATATRPSTRYEKMTTPDGVEVTMC